MTQPAPPQAPADFPPPPGLVPMAQVRCRVDPVQTLGAASLGERRFVPLVGGTVTGPGLQGEIVPGGVDWQIVRDDGTLEIAAHYVVRTPDGGLVEINSNGLRHGPPEVLAALARGEAVPPSAYFFRTLMRFNTGAPAWRHLNKVMGIAVGQRQANEVILDVYQLG